MSRPISRGKFRALRDKFANRRPLHCWADKRSTMIDQFGWGSRQHIETYGTDPDGDANATCMREVDLSGRHVGITATEVRDGLMDELALFAGGAAELLFLRQVLFGYGCHV